MGIFGEKFRAVFGNENAPDWEKIGRVFGHYDGECLRRYWRFDGRHVNSSR